MLGHAFDGDVLRIGSGSLFGHARLKLPLGRRFSLLDMELIQPKSTEDRARRRVAVVSLQANDNRLRGSQGVEVEVQGAPGCRRCGKDFLTVPAVDCWWHR